MKIAIEAMGIQNPGGGRSSILNLLVNLFRIDSQNEYLVILSKLEPGLEPFSPRVKQHIAPFGNRFLVRIWAQAVFPFLLRRFDGVHFTKNLNVWGVPIPQIITIHDLTILYFPEHFPKSDVFYCGPLKNGRPGT